MIEIPLIGKYAHGRFSLIDDEDYALVSDRNWSVSTNGYVVSNGVSMHRIILGLEVGNSLQGDHISGDRLDNRRSNLRAILQSGNSQNRRCPGASSKYRGVHWNKSYHRWIAQISVGRQTIHVGTFTDELEAARAAQRVRLAHMPYTVEKAIP